MTDELNYIETKAGDGTQAEAGKKVAVHYTGLLTNGQLFDSSVERGEPIEFPLGQGMVIKGWDLGIAKMKVGGQAILVIPPELGYGAGGVGPIPPNATLIFVVELVSVK
jgi:peptidylprolyl isomerase